MKKRKKNDPVTVCICCPVDDGARTEFWISLLQLITSAQEVFGDGVAFEFRTNPGDSLITRARNNLTHVFLTQSNADYLLFLDTDLEFSPEDIARLIESRREDAVVCGQYAIKQAELRLCHNIIKGETIGPDGLLKVAEAGTGCMMIPRKVLEAIKAKQLAPEYTDDQFKDTRNSYFDCGVVAGRYLSEDWLFCRRVRMAGFAVYVNSNVLLPHHGWAKYPLSDADLTKAVASRAVTPELLKGYRRDIDKAAKARWKPAPLPDSDKKSNSYKSSQAASQP